MSAVPLFPSLVAVIVAVPAAGPVTSPLALTVATPAALVAHAIVRPVSMFPLASFRLAVSCTVAPTGTLADAGLTTTDATGAGGGGGGGGSDVTVTVAVPLFPSLVAVMVAVPAATPATNPLPLTVATARLPLAQVTARPPSTAPAESFVAAASCAVAPTCTLAVSALTTTAATGDRKSTRLNSSHRCISYAVFCLKKKKKQPSRQTERACS